MQHLIGMPEPLQETGVLANHSSDFSLVKQTASQPASGWDTQTCLWRSHHDLKSKIIKTKIEDKQAKQD